MRNHKVNSYILTASAKNYLRMTIFCIICWHIIYIWHFLYVNSYWFEYIIALFFMFLNQKLKFANLKSFSIKDITSSKINIIWHHVTKYNGSIPFPLYYNLFKYSSTLYKSRLPATLFLPEQGMLNPHGKLHIFR